MCVRLQIFPQYKMFKRRSAFSVKRSAFGLIGRILATTL